MASNSADIVALFAKGLLGAIPLVGPLAAEVVGTIIPNQRIDRLETLLRLLDEKLRNTAQDFEALKKKFLSEEFVDLLEDGFYQAARALSDERKDYIASLLKNGLTDEQLSCLEYKKLLSMLDQLNDVEILILKSDSLILGTPEYDEFWEKHRTELQPRVARHGSTPKEFDEATIYETFRSHLVELGLVQKRFKTLKKGEVPEFDQKTGTVKTQGHAITSLGRLLLRAIDQGAKF